MQQGYTGGHLCVLTPPLCRARLPCMEHMYDGERCVFCNVNIYDAYLYEDPERCIDREPVRYSTETKEET